MRCVMEWSECFMLGQGVQAIWDLGSPDLDSNNFNIAFLRCFESANPGLRIVCASASLSPCSRES